MILNKKVSVFLVILLVTVLFLAFCCFKTNSIDFELVHEIEVKKHNNFQMIPWFSLVDDSFLPFFDVKYLTNDDGLDLGNVNYDFDFKNNSYIVCCGHELIDIQFRYSNVKRRIFGFIPYEFYAQATLSQEEYDKVFIYQIRRMNISCDYHNVNESTVYVKT